MGITLPLLIVLVAILAAMAVSAVTRGCRSRCGPISIISGTIINIFAVGITGYLNLLVSQRSPPSAGQFQDLRLPSFLIDIPVIGPLIDALLGVGPIALSMLVSVILLQVLLFRSRWALRTVRASIRRPRRWASTSSSCATARHPGHLRRAGRRHLTIEFGNAFQGEMTAGRGYIALAALIFGRWTPIGVRRAAVLPLPACSVDPDRATRGRAGRVPVHAAFAVLQRAALHHHHHRAGRRGRPRRGQPRSDGRMKESRRRPDAEIRPQLDQACAGASSRLNADRARIHQRMCGTGGSRSRFSGRPAAAMSTESRSYSTLRKPTTTSLSVTYRTA